MKISHSGVFVLLLFSLSVLAQTRTGRRPRESQLPEPEPPSCTVANWENGGRTRTWPRSYNSATALKWIRHFAERLDRNGHTEPTMQQLRSYGKGHELHEAGPPTR